MRRHTKIALAGLVTTTTIGLVNMNQPVKAESHDVNLDTNVVLNKQNTMPISKDIKSDIAQYPLGGK